MAPREALGGIGRLLFFKLNLDLAVKRRKMAIFILYTNLGNARVTHALPRWVWHFSTAIFFSQFFKKHFWKKTFFHIFFKNVF